MAKENLSQASTNTSTACKAAAYGTYETISGTWTTVMQKWYSNNRLQFIKTQISGRPENISQLFIREPVLTIDWGEVRYEGNQVQVWDVGKNKLAFRATLDEAGKPVASYLYNYMGSANEWEFIDTSYYYYTGGRLNYIIQLFEKRYLGASVFSGWEQYTFTYNASGDLAYHYARIEQVTTDFFYGSAPVSGTVADYVLTTSFRMLEFLDLIKVPINHQLYEVNMWRVHKPTGLSKFYVRNFYNYSIADGLVNSYLFPYQGGRLNYYIGWECEGTSAARVGQKEKDIIMSLDQFKNQYQVNSK